MVNQELVDAYKKLTIRHKLYEKAVRVGNSLVAIGGLIFFFSIIPITPTLLAELLLRLFKISLNFYLLWAGSILLGFILIVVGTRVNRRSPAPPKVSLREELFLKVFEALNDLDTYFKQNIEFSKVEAARKLSKIERGFYEPSSSSRTLWKELIKDRDEHLRLLKRNLKERLLPTINRGGKEEVKKTYSITEKFAYYLLNPTVQALKDLNDSMSELPTYIEEKTSVIPFLERHPKLQFIGYELVFAFAGFIAYYAGTTSLNISIEHAYYLAWMIWVTLTAGYAVKKK